MWFSSPQAVFLWVQRCLLETSRGVGTGFKVDRNSVTRGMTCQELEVVDKPNDEAMRCALCTASSSRNNIALKGVLNLWMSRWWRTLAFELEQWWIASGGGTFGVDLSARWWHNCCRPLALVKSSHFPITNVLARKLFQKHSSAQPDPKTGLVSESVHSVR